MSTDNPTGTTADALDSDEPVVSTVPVTELLKQKGTVPFLGFTPGTQTDYPDPVTPLGDRFEPSEPLAFTEALELLPQAGEGRLWAENEFVETTGGSVKVDTDAIRGVHGLDLDRLEAVTGYSLDQLADAADPDPLIRVTDHKDIIDRRRLALRALGFSVKFRWQISSDSYDPGDMQTFLQRKIAACRKQDIHDVFGWVRFHDWGGATQIVSIYPDLSYEISPDSDDDDTGAGSGAGDDSQDRLDQYLEDADDVSGGDQDGDADGTDGQTDTDDDADDDSDTVTVYYGERVGYGFRGTQTIWANPVIYVPEHDIMTPLSDPRYKRRHVGDVMDEQHERDNNRVPIVEWHESVLTRLEDLAAEVNAEISRARKKVIDFSKFPFSVAGFYQYLGIPQEHAQEAADRATSLATVSTAPTLWNLQLSLKLALLDQYQGLRAGDTYQEHQEVAGQIIRFPGQQLRLALKQYEREREADDESAEALIPDEQQTLSDMIDDITELPEVGTEDELSDREAQEIDDQVQRELDDLS